MYLVNGDNSPMCMCMSISSIRGQCTSTCTSHNTLCMQYACAVSRSWNWEQQKLLDKS